MQVPEGQWLIQSAASSTIGLLICQLAKHRGIRTLNVVRSAASMPGLKEAG